MGLIFILNSTISFILVYFMYANVSTHTIQYLHTFLACPHIYIYIYISLNTHNHKDAGLHIQAFESKWLHCYRGSPAFIFNSSLSYSIWEKSSLLPVCLETNWKRIKWQSKGDYRCKPKAQIGEELKRLREDRRWKRWRNATAKGCLNIYCGHLKRPRAAALVRSQN